MPELRTQHQQKHIVDKTLLFFVNLVSILLVVSVVSFIAYLAVSKFHSESVEMRLTARHAIVDTMSGSTPDEVKVIARTLLELDEQDAISLLENADDGSKNVQGELQSAAQSGIVPTNLSIDPPEQPDWLSGNWPWILALFGSILCVGTMISYLIYCFWGERYVADLNWRLPYTYALVAIIVLPFGWIFLAVSAVRMWRRPKTESVDESSTTPTDSVYDFSNDVAYTPHYREPEYSYRNEREVDNTSRKPVRFPNAPVAAKHRYIELRTKALTEYATREERSVFESITDTEDRLRSYGEEIKDLQKYLGKQKVRHTQLVSAREATSEPVSADQVASEFDRLMQLRGVKAVRIVNNAVSLLVEPVITHEGVSYDIGSWELRIGEGMHTLKSEELRTSVKKSWIEANGRGQYPDYKFPGESRFCFGSRQREIDDNVQKGQLLQAFELAIDCMHSTNSPEDANKLPDVFKKIKEEV